MAIELKNFVREIPDFPKKGIRFKDITPLWQNPEAFEQMGQILVGQAKSLKIDKVVGIESRGFIYGGYLAGKLGAGFVPIRKKGKLPSVTYAEKYTLEYGEEILEIHRDALNKGDRVLLHDDLLATGGTARASCDLVEKAGGEIILASFLIELAYLGGKARFAGYDVASVLTYEK